MGCSQSILEEGYCRIRWNAIGGMAYVVVNGNVLTVQAHDDPGSFFGPPPKRDYSLEGAQGALQCLDANGNELLTKYRFIHCQPMLLSEMDKIKPRG
jgi:hypothetical protein